MSVNPHTWPIGMQLAFMLIPFVIMSVGMALNACIAWGRDFEIMISSIQSSSWLKQHQRIWGSKSLTSRWLLVGGVSGLLAYPGLHIRRGQLDGNEIARFPKPLKRKIMFSSRLITIGFLWMLIAVGMFKLSEA